MLIRSLEILLSLPASIITMLWITVSSGFNPEEMVSSIRIFVNKIELDNNFNNVWRLFCAFCWLVILYIFI